MSAFDNETKVASIDSTPCVSDPNHSHNVNNSQNELIGDQELPNSINNNTNKGSDEVCRIVPVFQISNPTSGADGQQSILLPLLIYLFVGIVLPFVVLAAGHTADADMWISDTALIIWTSYLHAAIAAYTFPTIRQRTILIIGASAVSMLVYMFFAVFAEDPSFPSLPQLHDLDDTGECLLFDPNNDWENVECREANYFYRMNQVTEKDLIANSSVVAPDISPAEARAFFAARSLYHEMSLVGTLLFISIPPNLTDTRVTTYLDNCTAALRKFLCLSLLEPCSGDCKPSFLPCRSVCTDVLKECPGFENIHHLFPPGSPIHDIALAPSAEVAPLYRMLDRSAATSASICTTYSAHPEVALLLANDSVKEPQCINDFGYEPEAEGMCNMKTRLRLKSENDHKMEEYQASLDEYNHDVAMLENARRSLPFVLMLVQIGLTGAIAVSTTAKVVAVQQKQSSSKEAVQEESPDEFDDNDARTKRRLSYTFSDEDSGHASNGQKGDRASLLPIGLRLQLEESDKFWRRWWDVAPKLTHLALPLQITVVVLLFLMARHTARSSTSYWYIAVIENVLSIVLLGYIVETAVCFVRLEDECNPALMEQDRGTEALYALVKPTQRRVTIFYQVSVYGRYFAMKVFVQEAFEIGIQFMYFFTSVSTTHSTTVIIQASVLFVNLVVTPYLMTTQRSSVVLFDAVLEAIYLIINISNALTRDHFGAASTFAMVVEMTSMCTSSWGCVTSLYVLSQYYFHYTYTGMVVMTTAATSGIGATNTMKTSKIVVRSVDDTDTGDAPDTSLAASESESTMIGPSVAMTSILEPKSSFRMQAVEREKRRAKEAKSNALIPVSPQVRALICTISVLIACGFFVTTMVRLGLQYDKCESD
eukprot:PhM_4_TR16767/c1_g1_i8/m.74987